MLLVIDNQFVLNTEDILFIKKTKKYEFLIKLKNDTVETLTLKEDHYWTASDVIRDIRENIHMDYNAKYGEKGEMATKITQLEERWKYWNDAYYERRREHLTLKKKSERFTAKRTPSKKRLRAEISRLELLIENFEYNQKKYQKK